MGGWRGKGNKKGDKGKGRGKHDSSVKGNGAIPDGQERSDHTLHFYSIDEVLSALQKAVRRGHARNAAFWAGELCVSGLTNIAMKRLLIMTVEDVGITSPYAPFIASTAQAMLTLTDENAVISEASASLPSRLTGVCGLAHWIASLPKTRTSTMLSAFMHARVEERERVVKDGTQTMQPCSADDVGKALENLYRSCIGNAQNFIANSYGGSCNEFLLLEEEVFLKAYSFQLCQEKEADAIEPMFEVLGRAMIAEEQRIKAESRSESVASSLADLLCGFASVRKMVFDLQHLSTGVLDSGARMALNQALLLATRAHYLVLEGFIVVPSQVDTNTESDEKTIASTSLSPPVEGPRRFFQRPHASNEASFSGDVAIPDSRSASLSPHDLNNTCVDCGHCRIDGRTLARRNTRMLAKFARGRTSEAPIALNLQNFVRTNVLLAAPSVVPRMIFESLLLPAIDAKARCLRIPQYCIDVHTRRGSGYPMHEDWESRILPQNPGLQDWSNDEVKKTHGPLDSEGRQIAKQFQRYGLVISDEYFPGPSLPRFSMSLRPSNLEHFLAVQLPVAPLDHGYLFIDANFSPQCYGPSWNGSTIPAVYDLVGNASETVARIATNSPIPESGKYCTCSAWDVYENPATPRDPYFEASKTFSAWASEKSFPSAKDFPTGRLPKILENRATSTINDDPTGKKVSQTEHLIGQIEGLPSSVDDKRTAIDARPSPITELHRVRMHDIIRNNTAEVAVFVKKVEEILPESDSKDSIKASEASTNNSAAKQRRWRK